MITTNDINILEEKAKTIIKHVVNMIFEAGTGHPGGCLSCVDIITVLYFHQMRCNPSKPDGFSKDRFILSKGHAAPTLYATLAECG
jgi:transketolase